MAAKKAVPATKYAVWDKEGEYFLGGEIFSDGAVFDSIEEAQKAVLADFENDAGSRQGYLIFETMAVANVKSTVEFTPE